ncbi:unnamed protein product [Rotaria magnacalcarata]|nr:unnamed protein product [Rotaria magnacalcarata]
MKSKHILAVKHFDQFLKQHALPVCENANVLKKDQYWRSIILRSNERNDLMMTVVVHPQSLSKNEIDQVKKDLLNYFIDGSGHECEINSIYFQACANNRCTSEDNPFELIYGDEFIYEIYNEKKIRISPESFVQANKKAAELIYELTLKHAQIDENTIVLDIGSGMGVHSVMASTIAKKVYAIDPLALCIEDGKFNAKLNNCRDNIEWICGFSEIHLHRILKKLGDLHGNHSRIVAIVNPSRYSLSNRITTVLRSISAIQRIIYVSGKTDEQSMHNFYELAAAERSKLKQATSPFIPTSVYPIDLLPHTIHAEVVIKTKIKDSMAAVHDDTYESIGLVKPEVYVYVIPPRQSATRKHRAADWKLDAPNFICRLKIISKGEKCLIRLEDRNTGAHFATCPIDSYPSIAVENVEDSTRYFVIRVQNDNGQQAFLGMGFNDRSDSFDFNVALQDHFKYLKQAKQIEQEAKQTASDPSQQQQPKLDLRFKEGQTIKINLKSSLPGDEQTKKTVKNPNESVVPGILPPPPGSTIPKLTPPPGSTVPKIAPPTTAAAAASLFSTSSSSTTTTTTTATENNNNNNNIHSDLSWMQF